MSQERHLDQEEIDFIISEDNTTCAPWDRVNERADEVVDVYLAEEFIELSNRVLDKQKGKPCACRACAKRAVHELNNLVDWLGFPAGLHCEVVSDANSGRGFKIVRTAENIPEVKSRGRK
jgi:hypothetical protein